MSLSFWVKSTRARSFELMPHFTLSNGLLEPLIGAFSYGSCASNAAINCPRVFVRGFLRAVASFPPSWLMCFKSDAFCSFLPFLLLLFLKRLQHLQKHRRSDKPESPRGFLSPTIYIARYVLVRDFSPTRGGGETFFHSQRSLPSTWPLKSSSFKSRLVNQLRFLPLNQPGLICF